MIPLTNSIALAEDSAQFPSCWEAIPGNGTTPSVFLKINKCTGQTWMLTRLTLSPAKGSSPETFTWRWVPLLDQAGEGVLTTHF
jgi:hypothetical protein